MQAQIGNARLRMGCSFTLQPTHNLALDIGGWSTPILAALPPITDLVPIVQQSGWALGLVWTSQKHQDMILGYSSPL